MLLAKHSPILTAIFLCGLLLMVYFPSVHSESNIYVGVWNDSYSSNVIRDTALAPGSSFVVSINATNLPLIVNDTEGGLMGFDIWVSYGKAVLNATDVDFRAPLCPASEGCLFDQPNSLLLAGNINRTTGTVEAAMVLIPNGEGPARVDGSGILFRIRFQVLATGFSLLNIMDALSTLVGPVANQVVSIPYIALDGSFSNIPDNSAPTALFTYDPSSPVVGQRTKFNASESYDPDGPIASYAWAFGDGTTATGPEVVHSYSYAGNYTVTLTVTDDQGASGTMTETLRVTASTGGTGGTGGNGGTENPGGQTPFVPGPGIPMVILAGIATAAVVVLLLALMLRRKPRTP